MTIHDDRAVSTAVTHVLAIGITTLLISGLVIGAGGLLQDQKDSAAREELTTVGNRIAVQIARADQAVTTSDRSRVTFHVDQPELISGGSYEADLNAGNCDDEVDTPPTRNADHCLVVDAGSGVDVRPVQVPVNAHNDVDVEQTGSGEFEVTASPPSDPTVYNDGDEGDFLSIGSPSLSESRVEFTVEDGDGDDDVTRGLVVVTDSSSSTVVRRSLWAEAGSYGLHDVSIDVPCEPSDGAYSVYVAGEDADGNRFAEDSGLDLADC
jgi:hypothetical protein